MAAVYRQYTREMYNKFDHLACWLPHSRMDLGDVGRFDGYRFERLTSLRELGVPFEVGQDSLPADMEYASANAVTVSAGVEVGVGPKPAEGSSSLLSITFAKEGSTFFQAADCVIERATNLPALGEALLPLCRNGLWQKGFTVVTTVVRTGPAVVLVSSSRDGRIEFRLGSEQFGVPTSVARVAGRLEVVSKSGLEYSTTAEGMTPLFEAMHMKKQLGGKSQLVFKGEEQAQSLSFVPVTLADLEQVRRAR